MLHLICGPDTYRARKKIDELAPDKKSLRVIDGTAQSFDISSLSVNQTSLFGNSSVLILRDVLDFSRDPDFFSDLQEALEKAVASQVVIIYQSGEIDKRFKFTKWLRKEAQVFEFAPLRKPALRRWLLGYIGADKIDGAAIEKLIEYHGSDLWRLTNELNKLTAYTAERKITIQDVAALSAKSVEENIFEFTDALSGRDRKYAASCLKKLLTEGQEASYIFHMLVRQFRLLLLSKYKDGLKGLHPFVTAKLIKQSPRWEVAILKEIYSHLLEIDLSTKMGGQDLETQLWKLVAGV
ncbi:DNA polymerase III subunit delta [Patescibacteria group bacterium]|nr:DNA polymerase III subunit delta [Patescibacteria group bacterium]